MKNRQLSKIIISTFLGCIALTPLCQANAASPMLLVMDKEKDICKISVQLPANDKTQHWFDTPECPKDMVFDNERRKAVFLQKDKYFSVEFKADAVPAFFADAYKMPVDFSSETKTMIDLKTGNLQFAYILNGDDTAEAKAIVMERKPDGQWNKIAEKPTTIEMEGATGLGVVLEYMAEKTNMFTLQGLLMEMSCAEQQCMDSDNPRFKVPANMDKALVDAVVKDDESGETMVTNISLGENEGFLAGAVFGDTMHWTGPAFYYSKTGSHEKAQYRDQQSLISSKSNYVLISKEYESTSATLYTSGMDGKPFVKYKPDTVVVWLPTLMNWQ